MFKRLPSFLAEVGHAAFHISRAVNSRQLNVLNYADFIIITKASIFNQLFNGVHSTLEAKQQLMKEASCLIWALRDVFVLSEFQKQTTKRNVD